MPPHPTPTPGAIERAREAYDAGVSLAEIARMLAVTQSTLWRWRKQWGWPPRGPTPRRAAPTVPTDDESAPAEIAETTPDIASGEPPDTAKLIQGVRRALEAELNVLTAQGQSRRGTEPRSRALANIARTLATVRELEAKADRKDSARDGQEDDTPPVDIAELRNELARRLDRLRRERDAS